MLLEGLIAILIFSMGILAIVGMQAVAIKNSTDAKYRADASYFANQIIGQMWADRFNLASYANYAGAGTTCSPTGAASGNVNVTNWLTAVASLPSALANKQQIVIGANNLVTVTICWQAPQDNAPHNFVATAQIN
ncbi:MAG: hypothetical protein HKM00_00265 [Gallionella sp.]|nr:hypothetical protein [Gallionella sp.]